MSELLDEVTERIEVLKYSLKYDPPTLMIEYFDNKVLKKFVRKIKFKVLRDTDPVKVTDKIIRKNSDILSKESVSFEQLLDLVRLLLFCDMGDDSIDNDESIDVAALKINSSNNSKPQISPKSSEVEDGFGDLNKVSEETNLLAKSIMNVEFEKNRITRDDEGFLYDKRVEFDIP